MRINGTAINNLVQSAASLSAQQAKVSQQLSSGVRISELSDDAAAVGQSSTLSSAIAQADSFSASAATARSRGQAADTALASVVTQLTSALSVAVQGQDATSSASERTVFAQQLSTARDTLLTLANSSYGGSYLFAGTATGNAPFQIDGSGNVTYAGNSQVTTLSSGQGGAAIATSASGSDLFLNAAASVFGTLQSAINALGSGSAPGAGVVVALRTSLSVVTFQRAAIDTNLNRIDAATSYTSAQETNLKVDQSKLIASDPVALASQLAATQSQRSALLSTLAIVQKGSLFDYM